ncbi:MAG: glycoside hydrolase family 10 protein [Candidatus Kapaibacteriota bacterium]
MPTTHIFRTILLLFSAIIAIGIPSCAAQPSLAQSPTTRIDTMRQGEKPEVRGVWLTLAGSSVLDSRENIAVAMRMLREHGFNAVFPVVWARGFTLWRSARMQREFGYATGAQFGGRDVLAEVIREARANGLAVIPWFEYGFAAFYAAPGPLLQRHPEWACIGQNGAPVVKNGFHWMNALDSNVQNFMSDLVMEVAEKYDIDGVQGDDRLPAMPSEGGYDSATVALYRRETGRTAPQNTKDAAWVQWRANKLTEWLSRLRRQVKARKNIIVAMSPSPFPFGNVEYLQDSPMWMQRGLVDLLSPQLYRRNGAAYQTLVEQLQSQLPAKARGHVAPGILGRSDPYVAAPQLLTQCIEDNRTAGFVGSVIFYYEALTPSANQAAKFLRESVYRTSVAFPKDSLLKP